MTTKCGFAVFLVTSVGLAITGTVEAQTHTTTFTQSTPIVVPAGAPGNTSGTAAPYPSSITVSGLSGVTYHVSVRLSITHTFPADLNILLVAPGGYPAVMRCDNGPELACAAMADWAGERVGLAFIPPGQPWRNGYIESFNSRVRDECLNINMFWSLTHARGVITDWKDEYNHHRRHSAPGYQTPARYAAACTHH